MKEVDIGSAEYFFAIFKTIGAIALLSPAIVYILGGKHLLRHLGRLGMFIYAVCLLTAAGLTVLHYLDMRPWN